MEIITVSALFLTAICLIEWLHFKEKESLLNERKQLLDRVQARDYTEFKKFDIVPKTEPREVKKPINYI